jgi:molybdate transport repressor ModE-like protein
MAGNWQWDDLRVFLTVSREGSFSAAARALGIDHVTVGRRLAALEVVLGAKLLHRTPEGAAITPAGHAIVAQCEAMEAAARSAERLIAGRDTRVAGTVRVTATEKIACEILLPCIAEARRQHPELQIDLLTGVRSLDIARREADVAVRISLSRPTQHRVVCRKLGEIGFTLYASDDYLARAGTPARGKGLAGHEVIRFLGAARGTSEAFVGEPIDGARTALRCNNQFAQFKACADGLGIIEAACCFADDCPGIRRLWPGDPPVLKPAWLLCHEDMRRATRIRVVSSAIVNAFEQKSKLLRFGLHTRGRGRTG